MKIENLSAVNNIARVNKVKNFMNGAHQIQTRKDFSFKGEVYKTAKIILQSAKSVAIFHTSYIAGNPTTLNGDENSVALAQAVYNKGIYTATDYEIAYNLYKYGNAYEYVYKDENGVVRSKVFRNEDSYPIYDDNGDYTQFIEMWVDLDTNTEHQVIYTDIDVTEFKDDVIINTAPNATGLPIHYTTGDMDNSGHFGVGVIEDLIPITDEIELLLSKMSDSVSTLSLNPLGVSVGDRVDTSIDRDATGATLNIESGGDFKWATANLDTEAIKEILNNLVSQYWTVAQVPSVLYGQSNVANISEVSLKLLFNTADNLAKRTAIYMLLGFHKRFECFSKLLGETLECSVVFNYNRPVDNSSIVDDVVKQVNLGIMSIETGMAVSPYVTDVDKEIELIKGNDNVTP